MNKIDKKILQLLQENAKISNLELAEKVSLSPSPCLRRVKQQEEQGFIKKQVAILDTEKLGLQLTIFVSIGLKNHGQALMNEFTQLVYISKTTFTVLIFEKPSFDLIIV